MAAGAIIWWNFWYTKKLVDHSLYSRLAKPSLLEPIKDSDINQKDDNSMCKEEHFEIEEVWNKSTKTLANQA